MGNKTIRSLALFLLLWSFKVVVIASEVDTLSISVGAELVASSQPVAIDDMISGWDGRYYGGELAFADAVNYTRLSVSDTDLGGVSLRQHYRRYYYLEFSKDTADFYRAAETSGVISSNKKLELSVKHFEGPGIGLSYTTPHWRFDEVGLSLTVIGDWYRPGHFQFGEASGLAQAGATDQVAANIDYRYDEDKILDSNSGAFAVDDVEKGDGYSFSLQMTFNWDDFRLDIGSRDVINRFEWSNGAFTRGCVNVGGGVSGVCQTGELQNGFYGNQATSESIYATHSLSLSERYYGYQLGWLRHNLYERYSIAKSFATKLGRFDVFLYHPAQLGFGWQYKAFKLRLASDDQDWEKARNLNLDIALGWQW